MSQEWVTTDANGKPLTDGRICLVIRSNEPGMPEIRTYGRDKDEVLEKLAVTTETAQSTIHRLRTSAPTAGGAAQRGGAPAPVPPRAGVPTADQLAVAAADLSNPAKAGAAIKTLLKGSGIDLDAGQIDQAQRRLQNVAHTWHNAHTDFPDDERNKRILLDRAILRVGFRNVDAAALDNAYAELVAENMFHEAAQPSGSSAPRAEVIRTATTHRRNSLRAGEPVAVADDSPKLREWKRIAESGNSKELANAIRNIPGFMAWMDKQAQAARTA